ncbi:hypothetical protein ACFSTA_14865 [Ornithinibacillus salinisoli]|uniref:Uncharacterized protein n=1 Tax=Ornithinibacillus salinisoli TaxID=1848459 RepID=A0ABW4VZD1_9BACI
MNNSTTSYYVSGNTAEGLVNFLASNVADFNHVIILKHPSHTLKTALIKKIMKKYEGDNTLEVLLSPLGSEFLDGVIVRDKSIAVVIDTIATSNLNGAIEIDLNLFSSEEIPKNEMYELAKEKAHELTEASYANFRTGLQIHDDLEEIYINEMNFDRANEFADEFIDKLLTNIPKKNGKGKVFDRLFGTNTKEGVVNVVPDILNRQPKNYFIKGRAGTGKSTFMKKISNACRHHGLNVELYHCSFDPNSIDMVLVRDLDFCIFDSTDPHEFFPMQEDDEIVDLYQALVTPGTDEKYATEIDKYNNEYKSYMKKGIVNLQEAGDYVKQMEQHFVISENEMDRIVAFILEKIVH